MKDLLAVVTAVQNAGGSGEETRQAVAVAVWEEIRQMDLEAFVRIFTSAAFCKDRDENGKAVGGHYSVALDFKPIPQIQNKKPRVCSMVDEQLEKGKVRRHE